MPRDGSANRARILDAAETLVIDNGFAATSVDDVLRAAGTSKGAFFHHFSSKLDLARALTERYVLSDVAHLHEALDATADIVDPVARLCAFVKHFEAKAEDIMYAQSGCLYIAVLAEQDLLDAGNADLVNKAIEAWRDEIAKLLRAASRGRRPTRTRADLEALADHVFVTFEGAFLLCRSTGEPDHMRRQLRALRQLLESTFRA